MALAQDLWEKGFQLAYFLFPERGTALRILTGALNKLSVQRGREGRRAYWRDKHLKRGITRITRDEGDALQWLIFSESDLMEKEQEDAGAASVAEMVVRYIKNLVRMTTAMSSFYVNVGLHRLLYNYSTTDTQRVYEALTARFLGADEYRRAKSALMKKLEKRFHGMLKTFRTQHGELRFEPSDEQDSWTRLVDQCLKAFTPWSTLQACPVPSNFDGSPEHLPPRLSGHGDGRVDLNQVEINRCHAFIDPICDGRLMEALLLQSPMEKLALPRFHMENQDNNMNPTRPEGTSGLTASERESISKQLAEQAKRRKQSDPQSIIVVVDGEVRAQLPMEMGSSRTINLTEGDTCIELHTQFNGEDLLLAMHSLAYTESSGFAASKEALWNGRDCALDLNIAPGSPTGEEPAQAAATIHFKANAFAWFTAALWQDRRKWIAPMAFASGLLIAGVIVTRYGIARRAVTLPEQAARSLTTPLPTPMQNFSPVPTPVPRLLAAHITYRLVPDEEATRSPGGSETDLSVPGKATVIDLELPVRSDYAHDKFRASLKIFLKPEEIASKASLRPVRSKGGWIVNFPVSSDKLQSGQDYSVELQSGKDLETVESYGFHTTTSVK